MNQNFLTLDSHHHFWRYSAAEYGWIGDEKLRRDFGPLDLKPHLDAAGVDGVVSVQARETLDETRWLLDMARENPWIRAVVGWVPLAAPDLESVLGEFSGENCLKSVRHIVQGEADGFLEGAEFNAGIALLSKFDLAYDLLIIERQLAETIALVDRHPSQVFVLDHIAKPRIKAGVLEPWNTQIRELARRENVWCKVSGMVTEADAQSWQPQQLQPYFEAALEAFGARRLMFGSDWPVCLSACDYGRWADVVREWTAPLSSDERAAFWGGNARRTYKI